MSKSPNILTLSGRALTLKQRKWIKEYIETGNATEAAMRVYDVKDRDSAETIGSENLGKLALNDLMDEMGLTDLALLNIGAEGMTKPVKQSMTGEIHPDYGTRHRYWETMLKLKKRLDSKEELENGNQTHYTFNFGNGFVPPRRDSSAASETGNIREPREIQGISVASESKKNDNSIDRDDQTGSS